MNRLVGGLPVPDRPEHHYRYDPAKAHSYAATTLAWVGDPAAEEYARGVVDELVADGGGRPRRIASARLDLSLALIAANKLDEASAEAAAAIGSGRVALVELVAGERGRRPRWKTPGPVMVRPIRELYEANRPTLAGGDL